MQSHPLIFCITFCISIGLIFFPLNPQYTFRSVPHRFIRPGAVRKAIIAKDNQGKIIPEGDTDVTGLMCSAYQNTDGKEVFVMINYAAEDKEFTFYQRNGIIKNWTIYRTSDKDGENLLPVGSIKNHEKVVIPARSIITLVTQ